VEREEEDDEREIKKVASETVLTRREKRTVENRAELGKEDKWNGFKSNPNRIPETQTHCSLII